MKVITLLNRPVRCYETVSAQGNLREQVKPSGRSQNCWLQKGLPA